MLIEAEYLLRVFKSHASQLLFELLYVYLHDLASEQHVYYVTADLFDYGRQLLAHSALLIIIH